GALRTWSGQPRSEVPSTKKMGGAADTMTAPEGQPTNPATSTASAILRLSDPGSRSVWPWLLGGTALVCVVLAVVLLPRYWDTLSGKQPQQETEPVSSEQSAGQEVQVAIPSLENLRREFGLKIAMLGGRPGPDGQRTLIDGDPATFRIEVER